uniref:PIN domain-containing protein n=1 Tax=Tanacetum cinerariifolium TaxID=118510 RepID=A0A699JFL7_TANCI|nr:hypothetical protein [Tanacetum cinerariifolium]
MALTFADTHNMIAYLTKSDASEGFDQIIDFLNGSSIKYALTTSVLVKKVNDVVRLQALVNKKKVIITEATIRDALLFDDAKGIDCLPNEEIFAELSRMGLRLPSFKLRLLYFKGSIFISVLRICRTRRPYKKKHILLNFLPAFAASSYSWHLY